MFVILMALEVYVCNVFLVQDWLCGVVSKVFKRNINAFCSLGLQRSSDREHHHAKRLAQLPGKGKFKLPVLLRRLENAGGTVPAGRECRI